MYRADSSTANSSLLELKMISCKSGFWVSVEVDDPGIPLWFSLKEATTSNMPSNDESVRVN